jgi:aminoglycoside 6'-N-acetyltransferase I
MVQIAKLTKEDKGHVRALELFIMKEYFEATLGRKWDDLSQEFVDQLGATHKGSYEHYLSSGLSFVAKEDGQIVGYVFAKVVEHMSNLPKAVWVENIGVHPSYRRRGIGMQLLKRVAAESKKKGAVAVTSAIMPDNPKSIMMHKKAGFFMDARKIAFLDLAGVK